MAITTDKSLRLTFGLAGGGTSSLTLPAPREDLTTAEVQAVMQLVISRNIFTGSGGDFTEIRDIKIIDTTVNDLYDPPAG